MNEFNAQSRVGVVGVGRMGANMARRLSEKGCRITTVFDARQEVAQRLADELHCKVATRLSDLTETSDFILTVVTDDQAMRKIFFNSGDNLLTDAIGKVFLNFATVSPAVHLEIERQAKAVGASTVEACMASSITQAREGSLYLILAGERSIVNASTPILQLLSSSHRYVGATGNASQVKALVNMVMNINTAGLAEGLAIGDALGLDLTMLREIFSQTGANSRVLETDGADMQNREHDCYFSAAHAAKDSGIALILAASAHVQVPVARATFEQYRLMVDRGFGEMDKSGIAELTFKGRGKP